MRAAVVSLALAFMARPAAADPYSYLSVIIPGSISGFATSPFVTQYTEAGGINSSGTIVGDFGNIIGLFSGYTNQAGSISVLPRPPNSESDYLQANGINDSGVVVGTYFTSSGPNTSYGYTYSGGVFTTISEPNAMADPPRTSLLTGTNAIAINNAGAIAGFYTTRAVYAPYPYEIENDAGFVYAGGVYTTITVPGASSTFLYGINNSGEVSGYYTDANGINHGFLDQNGNVTTIDVPGATNTYATGLNDAGQLVGFYSRSGTDLVQGFLDSNGVITTLTGPPAGFPNSTEGGFRPFDISDAGVIVGTFDNGGGSSTTPSLEGVIGTPITGGTSVPEPTTLTLFIPAALLGIHLARRRA